MHSNQKPELQNIILEVMMRILVLGVKVDFGSEGDEEDEEGG